MEIIEIKSDKLNEPVGVYSQGIEVVNPNRFVFLSGFTSRNKEGEVVGKDDIRLQTETVLNNMRIALQEVGAYLNNIVKMTLFIKDMSHFKDIQEVRAMYFTKPYPACSMLEVSGLINKDHLIEIESIAII